MRKFIKAKNKGIVFWITGLSGSGKTQIGKKIKKDIIKNFEPVELVFHQNKRMVGGP